MPTMRSKIYLPFVALGFCGILWGSPASAQTPDDPDDIIRKPTLIFPQLFPNPTGTNGYEDLVRACDALNESAVFKRIEAKELEAKEMEPTEAGSDLREIRTIFEDPPVQKALLLLKSALQKPLLSPNKPGELSVNTVFPQHHFFRKLARLLSRKISVDAADGKGYEVIESTEMILRIGDATAQDTMMGGLVAIAIDAIALDQTSQFVAQLSRKDCNRLNSSLASRLNSPSDAARLYTTERDLLARHMIEVRDDRVAASTLDKAEIERLYQTSLAHIETAYRIAIENVSLPPSKRKDYAFPEDADPEIVAGGSLYLQTSRQVLEKYDQNQAQLRLLALHVAIRKFRWEHDRLPATLKELKHPELLTDPFTGKPLLYSLLPENNTYDLHAAGAIIYNGAGKPTKRRSSVYVPPLPLDDFGFPVNRETP